MPGDGAEKTGELTNMMENRGSVVCSLGKTRFWACFVQCALCNGGSNDAPEVLFLVMVQRRLVN